MTQSDDLIVTIIIDYSLKSIQDRSIRLSIRNCWVHAQCAFHTSSWRQVLCNCILMFIEWRLFKAPLPIVSSYRLFLPPKCGYSNTIRWHCFSFFFLKMLMNHFAMHKLRKWSWALVMSNRGLGWSTFVKSCNLEVLASRAQKVNNSINNLLLSLSCLVNIVMQIRNADRLVLIEVRARRRVRNGSSNSLFMGTFYNCLRCWLL